MSDYKKIELVKLNIKQFFSEIKSHREEKKKYRIDKLIQKLPAQSFGYEDLAPESDIKNGEEYLKALNWGLKNKRVRNIALAGPYGSGKSSIIESYLNKYPSTKALNISLAAFDFKEKNDEDFENVIELGILKQLFYKVDSNKIPQSRYRKIRKQYYRRYFFVTIGFVIFTLSAVAFFSPDIMENMLDRIAESGNYYGIGKMLSYITTSFFGITGILVIAYILKWSFSKFSVKEVNIADKATVADEKDESSIFDKSMDEIVYFFETTDYTTIFIEDLDRFDSTQIFVKLRELNTILNNYDLIKRKIVFVYAVRDDMFVNEERTKFFDFIIPVIPIINSTNSGEIIREKLKIEKQNDGTIRSLLYDISSSYITLISPFIEDMRVLTNICNEFMVYKNTLNSVKLKDEEMFSIMVFKNLYPEDFAKLESEKGVVKQAFKDKIKFIETKQKELEQQKIENQKILDGIEQDILNDVKEVKAAFLNYLVGTSGPFVCCNFNRKIYFYSQIMNEQFDISVFENVSKIQVFNQEDYYGRAVNTIIPEQEDIWEKIKIYCKRVKYLKNSEKTRKQDIRIQMEDCNKMISEFHTYTLKILIEKFGSENIFSDDVMQNKFLIFLLRKGFINENYADYINYFHPNSITKDEMNYIRGIRMQEAVGDFSYTIRNVEQVCERIEDYEFKQIEALNFDIVDYLLTKKLGTNKCTELFIGLAEGDKVHDEFIGAYIERKQNMEIFIKMLCKYYKTFWGKISKNNSLTEERKYYYLYLILEYANLSDVVEMSEDLYSRQDEEEIEGIYNFIVNNKQALTKLAKVSSERMIDIINNLKIVFTEIEIEGADRKIVEYIFDNDNDYYNYELNINMIRSLFKFFYPEKVGELETSNYTVILETAHESLLDNIHNNFECYVSEFIIGLGSNVNESINAVEDILERLFDCNVNLCLSTLDKENVIWDNIEYCCICTDDKKQERKIVWDYVLKNRKIKELWNNYFGYYEEYGFTSELIEWLNIAINSLIQEQRIEQLTDEIIKDIIIKDISLETFSKLIERYKVNDFDCSLSDFDSSKIAILIEHNYIPFTIEYLDAMKQESPTQIVDYIISNKEEFMKNITNITLDIDIISDLIKSNKFIENEIEELLKLFAPANMNQKMAYEIRKLEMKLEKPYVEKAWELLKDEDRYKLFLNQLDIYSNDEIALKLNTFDIVYKALSDRSRKHREYLPVDNIGYNEKFLDKLKKKNYITSLEKEDYEEEDHNTHVKKHMQRFVVWVKVKQ